ncbi:MAG: NFACT family protein [Firmicutes bacterium]|nr:NFACT family protein [Bacillota bacterium]
MAFDGIITKAMVTELRSELLHGKIDKIHQPMRDELVFTVHTLKGNKRVFASAGSTAPRVHLIEESPGNPPSPSPFCMLLRKHLVGGRIISIEQKKYDRIIEITLETMTELGFTAARKLIFEIMGKHSNIILVDASRDGAAGTSESVDGASEAIASASSGSSGIVIDAIKRVSFDTSRARQILPGIKYEYPPAQDKIGFDAISRDELESLPADAKAILYHVGGISMQVAEDLANIDAPSDEECISDTSSTINTSSYTSSYTSRYDKLRRIVDAAESGNFTAHIYYEDQTPIDFHIADLAAYEETCARVGFPTLSSAINSYFEGKASTNSLRQRSNDLTRTVDSLLEKARLKNKRLGEDLLEAENSEKYRIYGELLNANIHAITPGAESITLDNYYDGTKVEIPLDPKYSPAKNAQNYFKKYGKFKTAIKEKTLQIEETKQDIEYLESVQTFLENLDRPEDIDQIRQELIEGGYLRRRKTTERNKRFKSAPIKYTSPSGYEILVGKNNKENDELTLKLADKTDLWLHTKDIPGSHVIIRTRGEEPTAEDIYCAAEIAAWHSKAKSSAQVPVDYVRVRHVKKPAGAKPGMVIFTNNRTVYVTPKLP